MTSEVIARPRSAIEAEGMNASSPAVRIAAAVVLVAFSAFTVELLLEFGFVGFLNAAHSNGPAVQVFLDLVIALTFVLAWVVVDARRQGGSYWPVVLLTLMVGSIGPLLYVVVRPLQASAQRGILLAALGVLGALVAANWSAVEPSPIAARLAGF